ncbi:cell death regulator Aven [Neosynchiropus ocellatus]
MDARASRGRGPGGRRSGRGGGDSDSVGGEHRGRARGSHHRGRGKRDHYRGRGRGAGAHQRINDEDEDFQENEDATVYSRRTLESNWDRYEASERQESSDEAPTQRGADFRVLLESAGDSFSQFRFSEEKSWEMDSLTAAQVSSLDLPGLAGVLQQLPLHQRLDLEAELVQASMPVELPSVTSKQEALKMPTFTPPHPVLKPPGPVPQRTTDPPADEEDEELELLLSLEKPAPACSHTVAVETATEEPLKMEEDSPEKKPTEEHSKAEKKEVTEEDLEDWLDSMIS